MPPFAGCSNASRYFKDNCSSSDEEIQENITEETNTESNKSKGYRMFETQNSFCSANTLA